MKKQTLEIEVPDGKKAVWKDGKVVFEDIEPQLPNTWEEFCKSYPVNNSECYIDWLSNIQHISIPIGVRSIYSDKNKLPNKKTAEAHLAYMQLHQLRNCYRQGWVPNWNNKNEERYYILHNTIHYIISDTTIASKFLTFQSVKIARDFLNNFRDLIEQAGDLI